MIFVIHLSASFLTLELCKMPAVVVETEIGCRGLQVKLNFF